MNFIKTQKMLTQQAAQKEIPLESVLELMRTYLAELRYHTNTTVDRCRIGNMSQVIASLATVSNDILFVYRTNEKAIHAEESRVIQSLTKAQNACSTFHSRIAQLEEKIRQEETVQEKLKSLLEKEGSRSATLMQLQQQNAALQGKIDALSSVDPETEAGRLRKRIADQTAELARATEEYGRIQQEYAQNQQAIAEVDSQRAQLQVEFDKGLVELKEKKAIVAEETQALKELAHGKANLEHEIWKLKEAYDEANLSQFELHDKIKQAKAKLEEELSVKNLFVSDLTEKQTKLDEIQAQNAQLRAQVQELEERYCKMAAEQENEKAQLAAVQQEKSALLNELNANIAKLENQLQHMQEEASLRRADIAAASEALKAEREEFDQLLEQQVALEMDLEAQKTDNKKFRENHLDPIKSQMEALTVQSQKDRAQLEELKNSINLLENNRATLAQETAIVKLKLKSRESALDMVQTEYDRNKQAVAVLEENLRVKGTESAALLEKERELRELLDEKNVARITAELESCNRRLEEDIRRAEQTEKDLLDKQQTLYTLQQQLSAVQKELEDCRSKENELLENHKTASRDFERITGLENRQRCERLHNQLLVMQAMRKQLLAGSLTPCGDNFGISEQMQEQLSQAEQTLLALRGVIQKYTSMRQNALEG